MHSPNSPIGISRHRLLLNLIDIGETLDLDTDDAKKALDALKGQYCAMPKTIEEWVYATASFDVLQMATLACVVALFERDFSGVGMCSVGTTSWLMRILERAHLPIAKIVADWVYARVGEMALVNTFELKCFRYRPMSRELRGW